LPVEGFAIDAETEFPDNTLFVTRVYVGTFLAKRDSGNGTSKPFCSVDEFSQVRKGKGKFKE
jgi:hypothetical protein